MSQAVFYALDGVVLFCVGLLGLFLAAHLLRKVLALNIMSSGVFLLLVALAHRKSDVPDPVPHALVLTGIVVAVSMTGVALSLACRIHAGSGQTGLPEDGPR